MNRIAPKRPRVSPQARARAAAAPLAVGYIRVSTDEQAASGLGLDAQRAALREYAERERLRLVAILEDAAVSGTVSPDDRAGMREALRVVRDREAGTLIAARTDRLTRRNLDLYMLMDRSDREGWTLRTTDGVLDTSSENGRLMAGVAGVFAEFERRLIAQRTRDALAAKKAQGARLGRPVAPGTEALRLRVRVLHGQGMRAGEIAATLNAEALRTPTDLAWTARHVYRMLDSLRRDDEAASAALL